MRCRRCIRLLARPLPTGSRLLRRFDSRHIGQFEREVTGERIRDKVAASRKKGMWMGGWTPFGYEVRDRKLFIHRADAEQVRGIFKRFLVLKSATLLAKELVRKGATNRYGHLLDKGVLYKLLNNRVYVGDAVHKGTSYPGEHDAIIDRKLWDQVHGIMKDSPRKRAATARAQTRAILKGLLFGPGGSAMSPTHTRKSGKLYRYYISQSVMKRGTDACPIRQVPAAEIERIVIEQIRSLHDDAGGHHANLARGQDNRQGHQRDRRARRTCRIRAVMVGTVPR